MDSPRAALAGVGLSLGLAWLGWLGCAGQPQPRPARLAAEAAPTGAGLAGSHADRVEAAVGGDVAANGSAPMAATALFNFESHPWLSLHHFLYEWAVVEEAAAVGPAAGLRPVAVPERAALAELSAGEREAWLAAVGHYRRHLIGQPLVFDPGLIKLKQLLARLDPEGGSGLAALDPGLRAVVEPAMEIYRRHFWPHHDAANRAWTRGVVSLLATYETEIGPRLAAIYGGRLPPRRVWIEACPYASWAGAYTTEHPDAITVASLDPKNQGLAALEAVMHEYSHSAELEEPLRELLRQAFALRGGEAPRDLWHVAIFYTAGELTRQALAAHGIAGYEPYAEHAGLYSRSPRWALYRRVLERPWGDLIAGRTDRATAAGRIAEALSREAPQGDH